MGKQRGGRRGDGGSCIMFLWKQGLRPRLEPLRGRCPISGGSEDAKKQISGLFVTGQDPVPPETIWSPSHEPRRKRKLRAILRESSLCSSPHTAGYWRDVETGLLRETLTGSAKGPPYPWVCGYRAHAQVSNTTGFNQDDYSCTRRANIKWLSAKTTPSSQLRGQVLEYSFLSNSLRTGVWEKGEDNLESESLRVELDIYQKGELALWSSC